VSRHRMPERGRPLVVAALEKKKKSGDEGNGGEMTREEKLNEQSNINHV